MPTVLLRLPAVRGLTGLSRSSVYYRMARGTFPKQIQSVRIACWIESEIENWIETQIKQSRSPDGIEARQRRAAVARKNGSQAAEARRALVAKQAAEGAP